MLSSHLIAKTEPRANSQNLVFWQDFRITVLKNQLFRIEKDKDKRFNDMATQCVWFRDTQAVDFDVEKCESYVEIITDFCTLHVENSIEKSYALIGGKKIKLDNAENLKGTYRTLDGRFGNKDAETLEEIRLDNGVCSKNGVAVLDDASSLRLDKNGNLIERYPQELDIYVFAYGRDYRGALKALFDISGYPPLIPRYAFGNWWSRYHVYTDREYLTVLSKFERRKIPFTVATVDMDWHYSNDVDKQKKISESGRNTPYYGGSSGWTGYSWNKELFPNYKSFLSELKSRNYRITLNLHPADGVRWFEDRYAEFAEAMNIDPSTCKQIPFDITDDDFINAYFDILHKPYEKDGVDFWWIDWQQGTTSNKPGLDPMWALNHYHFLDNSRDRQPLILSRYCNVGSHRYPLGFSGDSYIVWETLDYLPYFTSNASNVGFTWWSHDIGGHNVGIKDDEMYVRFIQFGVFSPINRLHCTDWEILNKEPEFYMNGKGLIAQEFLRLRHKLIPYIYSANYRTHTEGVPLVEPLYYHEADDPCSYKYKNEYYFGEQLLVCPITKPSDKNGLSLTKVYLPKGCWTDVFTGDVYIGGTEREIVRTLDTYPVFAKEGAIIPKSLDEGNSSSNPKNMEIDAYNGNGSFRMVEDIEGENLFYTDFEACKGVGVQKLKISFSGDATSVPDDRSFKICFKNVARGNVEIFKNGERLSCDLDYDYCLSVVISDIDFAANYEAFAYFTPETEIEALKGRALRVISRFEGSNTQKHMLWTDLKKTQNIEEYKAVIKRYREKTPPYISEYFRRIEDMSAKRTAWKQIPKKLEIALTETL